LRGGDADVGQPLPRGSGQAIVKTDCICVPSELVQRGLIFVSFPLWNGPSAVPVKVFTSPGKLDAIKRVEWPLMTAAGPA
jgi:hypothetical protein